MHPKDKLFLFGIIKSTNTMASGQFANMIKENNSLVCTDKTLPYQPINHFLFCTSCACTCRRAFKKCVLELIWRITHVICPRDQILKNYIKFSEVRYSVLSICAARNLS